MALPEARARYLYHFPGSWGEARNAGALPEGDLRLGFRPYIWLGDEERGISWFAESDAGFHVGDPGGVTEIVRREDQVVLRINHVSTPVKLVPGAGRRVHRLRHRGPGAAHAGRRGHRPAELHLRLPGHAGEGDPRGRLGPPHPLHQPVEHHGPPGGLRGAAGQVRGLRRAGGGPLRALVRRRGLHQHTPRRRGPQVRRRLQGAGPAGPALLRLPHLRHHLRVAGRWQGRPHPAQGRLSRLPLPAAARAVGLARLPQQRLAGPARGRHGPGHGRVRHRRRLPRRHRVPLRLLQHRARLRPRAARRQHRPHAIPSSPCAPPCGASTRS